MYFFYVEQADRIFIMNKNKTKAFFYGPPSSVILDKLNQIGSEIYSIDEVDDIFIEQKMGHSINSVTHLENYFKQYIVIEKVLLLIHGNLKFIP